MKPLPIFLDGNVWNFLFERGLDLAKELPQSDFRIFHTREAEFEIPKDNSNLDRFIRSAIERCSVQTDIYFGFSESYPLDEQRFAGFGVGRWAHPLEIDFIQKHRPSSSVRPTKLNKHEADISLAARSFHACVLTLDRKSPAFRSALNEGGVIVYLNQFNCQKLTLAEFVIREFSALTNGKTLPSVGFS